jgi:hypothetical protein
MAGVHKSQSTKFCTVALNIYLLMELTSCHPNSAENFEVPPVFQKIVQS